MSPPSSPPPESASGPASDQATAGGGRPDYLHQPARRPFLIGVYLATNAIPDAATIVDGPDCAFFKTEFIHGKHDLNSTLLDVTGNHRILVSHVTTDDVATSKGERAIELCRRADEMPEIALVMVTALPMVAIIGIQYDQIIRGLAEELSSELVEIPGRSLQGDWLDGYADVLEALARRTPTCADGIDPGSVSIIGHLMDRNEEDQRGNVRELYRLVEALGLRLDSVWLSGRPWSELRQASRSGTLVALPLGRQAAQLLAERTGADVVELEVPFGAEHSARFVRGLGAATGREPQAEELVRRELLQIAPRLEWAVPHLFLGKRVIFSGAPDLLAGFADLAQELGMEVLEMSSPARRPSWFEPESVGDLQPLFDVSLDAVGQQALASAARPDLVIGNTETLQAVPPYVPGVELGYPSYADHAFVDRPFLGFRGYLQLVQRMASAMGLAAGRIRR
jgi:nitrogenase molybdenum-iron protein alpha/beta subunit